MASLLASPLVACGQQPVTSKPQQADQRSAGGEQAVTYYDLLTHAPVDASSEPPCLFRLDGAALRLATPLAPATQALPELLSGFEHMLQQAQGGARLLTPFGRIGPQLGDGPVLVSLTEVPAQHFQQTKIAGWLDTHDTLWLRAIADDDGRLAPAPQRLAAPWTSAQLATAATTMQPAPAGQHNELTPEESPLLFLAVEPTTPSTHLLALLEQLPAQWEVVLSASLPGDTRLPPEPDPMPSESCQEWPPPLGGMRVGEIAQADLLRGIAPLSAATRRCMESAQGAAVGRIELGLRIGEDGKIAHACLLSDALQDGVLTHCVLQAARNLRFQPAPDGPVDVVLPLRLTPPATRKRATLCRF